MGMTIAEKIIAGHAGLDLVTPGQLVTVMPDMIMANDITGPAAINEFDKLGIESVFDNEKIILVPDHFAPCKDIASAGQCRVMRDFARKMNITHYYEQGRAGIEHCILPEFGLVTSGGLYIGADSHTCTYGALNCLSTGVGSTDFAAAMANGKCWLKVPETIRVELTGRPAENVSGKDIILSIIGILGVDGAGYKALEFGGGGLAFLSIDDRFTMANMVIEAGAKCGCFEFDSITEEYIRLHAGVSEKEKVISYVTPDSDAAYCSVLKIELDKLERVVAAPSLPSNIVPVSKIEKTAVDQVVIGSCTNGRISDMRVAAGVLRDRKVADNIRLIIIPGSKEIYRQCLNEGLIEIFLNADAVVSTPTCGPCLGGYMGILDAGEVCVSTTNRNFVGRMGHRESRVYLASPYTAAQVAVKGYLGG